MSACLRVCVWRAGRSEGESVSERQAERWMAGEGDEGGEKEKRSKGSVEEKVMGKEEIRRKDFTMERKPMPFFLLLFLIPVSDFFAVV